jgi:hypothetical protein
MGKIRFWNQGKLEYGAIHQGDIPSYFKVCSFEYPRTWAWRKTIKAKDFDLLLDALHFVGISRHNRVPNKDFVQPSM